MKYVVAVLLMLLSLSANAKPGDLWLDASVTSYHFSGKKYNEHNYGFGLEYDYTDTIKLAGGYYQNSLWKQSRYIGGMYLPIEKWGLKFGVDAAMITGYAANPGRYIPVVAPTVVYENSHGFGLNMVFMPPVTKKVTGAIGLQLKVEIP